MGDDIAAMGVSTNAEHGALSRLTEEDEEDEEIEEYIEEDGDDLPDDDATDEQGAGSGLNHVGDTPTPVFHDSMQTAPLIIPPVTTATTDASTHAFVSSTNPTGTTADVDIAAGVNGHAHLVPATDSSSSYDAPPNTARTVRFDADSGRSESTSQHVRAGAPASTSTTLSTSTGPTSQEPSHTVEKTDGARGVRLAVPRAHRGLPSARLPDGAPPKSAFKIFDSEDEDIDF